MNIKLTFLTPLLVLSALSTLFFTACSPSKEMLTSHEAALENKQVEKQAQSFFDLLVAGKYSDMAKNHNSLSLKEFRASMAFMDSIPAEFREGFYSNFFGGIISKDSVNAMTDAQYFGKFLETMMERAKLSGGLEFKGIKVLGVVKQGEQYHIITLSTVTQNGEDQSVKELQTFVREGETYKALISEDMMNMPAKFQQMAQQAMMQQQMAKMQAEQAAIQAEEKAASDAAAQDSSSENQVDSLEGKSTQQSADGKSVPPAQVKPQ